MRASRLLLAAVLLPGCGSGSGDEEAALASYRAYADAVFHKRFEEARRLVAGSPSMGWHNELEGEAGSTPQFECDGVSVRPSSQRLVDGQRVLELELVVSYAGNFGAGFFPPDKRYRQTVTMTRRDGSWKVGKIVSTKLK